MAGYSKADEKLIREVFADPDVSDGDVDSVLSGQLDRRRETIARKRRRMGLNLDDRGGDTAPDSGPEVDDEQVAEDVDIDSKLRDYVKVGDTYVFRVDEGVYPIDADKLDEMCADYSNYGGSKTCAEVARAHGIPSEALRRIFHKLGHYKASLPATRETVAEAEDEDIVEAGLAAKERRIAGKLDHATIAKLRRENRKFRQERHTEERFVELAREMFSDVEPEPVTVPLIQADPGAEWTAYVPTTDEHIGSLVWAEEAFGENYDLDIACHRLRRHADHVAAWIAAQPGRCKRIYRAFVGDLWHALLGMTEHETRIDQDTRSAKVYAAGIAALKYAINKLRTVADEVVVFGSRGNHDGRFEFFATLMHLQESFSECPDVTVESTPSRYTGFIVGRTLHVLDHDYAGGKASGWKRKASAEVVARHVAGAAWSEVDRIITWMGHLHELEVASAAHSRLVRLPALGEPDAHATDHRYDNDDLKAIAYRLDDKGRPRDPHWIYREDIAA